MNKKFDNLCKRLEKEYDQIFVVLIKDGVATATKIKTDDHEKLLGAVEVRRAELLERALRIHKDSTQTQDNEQ